MARTGMTSLIEELRGMTEAGTSDYTVGTSTYWGDNALQDVLDLYRRDIIHARLASVPITVSGGTLKYYDYRSPYKFLEQTSGGTSIFYVQDGTGATIGTSLWSADYRRGVITFSSNTEGTSYYLTARSYDLNAAAADVWRKKAAHYAPTSFDFSTDNHSISRAQVYEHCVNMADFFDTQGRDAIGSVTMYRMDTL